MLGALRGVVKEVIIRARREDLEWIEKRAYRRLAEKDVEAAKRKIRVEVLEEEEDASR